MRARRGSMLSILLVMIAVAYMLPFAFAVTSSFKSKAEILLSPIALPRSWSVRNYVEAIKRSNFAISLMYSLTITATAVAGITIAGATAGYAIARSHSALSLALLSFFGMSMFVPFQTIMIPLLRTAMSLRIVGSVPGLILIYIGLGCPLAVFLYYNYMRAIPRALEESAVIEGCTHLQVFRHIMLPLARPVTGVVAVLQGLWIWNDFLLPYLILQKPLTIPLNQVYFYHSFNRDWNYIMAMFVLSTVPVILLFLCFQRRIISGLIAGAVKQ